MRYIGHANSKEELEATHKKLISEGWVVVAKASCGRKYRKENTQITILLQK